MARIVTTIDREADLTAHVASGTVVGSEVLALLDKYYAGPVTTLVLWDFTDASFSEITPEQVRELARRTKEYGPTRPGGKTALVFGNLSDYGVGRMFEILSSLADENVVFQSFCDMRDAREWLGLEPRSE